MNDELSKKSFQEKRKLFENDSRTQCQQGNRNKSPVNTNSMDNNDKPQSPRFNVINSMDNNEKPKSPRIKDKISYYDNKVVTNVLEYNKISSSNISNSQTSINSSVVSDESSVIDEHEQPSDAKKVDFVETPPPPQPEVKKHPEVDTPELFKKRKNVASEFRDTEAAFVEKMEVTEKFVKLIEEKLPELMVKDSQFGEAITFADINKALTFVSINKAILDRLNDRLSKWDENPIIADIFNNVGHYLKSLSQFIRQFDKFMETYYNLLQKNSAFKKVVEEFEMSLESKLKMSSYFLCPVQRIPRYPLLMREYFKAVPTSASDYAATKQALELLENVASHSNESKGNDERSQQVFELIKSIQNAPDNPTPSRYISKKGRLLKICRKACEERFFVLFTDVLWYMNITPTNGLKFRYEIPLVSAVIRRYPSNLEIVPFQIDILGSTKSVGVSCKSKEEHDSWYSALHDNISEEKQKLKSFGSAVQVEYAIGQSSPLWVPDWTVTICSCCKTPFSTIRRRHHCRACGNAVCSGCSQRSLTLEYSKNEKLRVCDTCYALLTNNEVPLPKATSSSLPEVYDHFGAMEMREGKGKWTSFYFIIANNILYQLRARNDSKAIKHYVILSYEVDQPSQPIDNYSENLIIILKKHNMPSFFFRVFKPDETEKWLTAFKKNTECIVDG